jgi:hypothetical protein
MITYETGSYWNRERGVKRAELRDRDIIPLF